MRNSACARQTTLPACHRGRASRFLQLCEASRYRGVLLHERGFQRPNLLLLAYKDEIPIIEKKMKDEVIGTHRAAARLYRAEQQIAAPRSDVTGPLEVPGLNGAGGDEFKDIVQNPELWGRKMATRVLNDFRGGRGQRWL